MSLESNITIFTDGSSRGNPGPGGFGAVVITPENIESGIQNREVREIGGREERTTNNKMELQAAISALLSIPDSTFHILIYSDSSYLVSGITRWVHGWQKNGWKTKEKKEVENKDLWKKLIEACRNKDIQWKQIGGHIGVAGNMRCDEIATAFADGKAPTLYSGILENYSIENILDVSHEAESAKEKNSNRTHSNAKAYSYVSLVGGKVKTHKTWAECEARVRGKPARFKKATSKEMEADIISDFAGKK